jgi:hypothetical protein
VITQHEGSSAAGAVAAAKAAEQVILFLGESDEGEGRDRKNTTLDEAQQAMALAAIAVGKPTVVVLMHGGILSVDSLAGPERPNALVNAWFPGIKGAEAMAKSLFGVPGYNRWGKMTATMYASSFSSLVPMLDMSFTSGLGRTYRYWRGPAPLFEFGHGLSLTTFSLKWHRPVAQPAARFTALADNVTLHAVLTNAGSLAGDEVVLLFAVPVKVQRPLAEAGTRLPYKRLIDFVRVSALSVSASANVTFTVGAPALGLTDSKGDTVLYGGEHAVVAARGHGANLTAAVAVAAGASGILVDTLM